MNSDLGRRGGCTWYFPLAGLILLLGFVLMGCAGPVRPATIAGGECRIFEDPGRQVRGLTTADRRWIATTQETGIQVCGWKRPPSMPEPVAVAASFADCPTVHQIIAQFGGDVARAESYVVSQGATPQQVAAARACLGQPAVVARPGLGSRHRMTKRQQTKWIAAPSVATVSTPVSPVVAAPVVVPLAVSPPPAAAPVTTAKRKCKPRKYSWQYWRPKVCL